MKEKIIQAIIDNKDRIPSENIGLFDGKMGVCFVLYCACLENNHACIEEIADDMLDEVIMKMNNMSDLSFSNGLMGIGWAINRLHMESCVQGDIDDVLYNIDALLYRALTKNNSSFADSTFNLLCSLIYITDRLSNPRHNDSSVQHLLDVSMLRLIVNKFSEKMPSFLLDINHDVAPHVSWEHSVLFFYLEKVMRLGMCNSQIDNMMMNWEVQLCTSVPFFNINKLSFACALESLNSSLKHQQITRHVKCILYSIDRFAILKEIKLNVHCISTGWGYATWVLSNAVKIFPSNDETLLLRNVRFAILRRGFKALSLMLNKNSQLNISLVSGLSGILLLFNLKTRIL